MIISKEKMLSTNSSTEVSEKNNISDVESETNGNLTFNNGIRGWVVSIFIDLINSTELFQKKNDKTIAKVIRTFASVTIHKWYSNVLLFLHIDH